MVIDNAANMLFDGSVWITNNTKYHNAFNGGEENRIHLVACVLIINLIKLSFIFKKICIASDHAGYNLKETIKNHLTNKHLSIFDLGLARINQ